MHCTSLRMSRCFPEPADLMAGYRLHRGIDRRDVAEAHTLALGREGPPATYIISATTPFQRRDAEKLLIDAPAAIERRCPGLIGRMASQGWRPPASIDRVYDSSLAARELGGRPCFGIEACLAGDWDPLPSR
jgi:UDP-glucose 4-epimerase